MKRSLALWHDHATILNSGFIMVTLHTVYDTNVSYTNEEYHTKTGESTNVQAEVKQPELYVLVVGFSSIQDQSAVIPDRVECLIEMHTPLHTANSNWQLHVEHFMFTTP